MTLKLQNKLAVATVSLGRHPSHSLERKIRAAAAHGFHGIELVHAELVKHANEHDQTPLQSAHQIRELCRASSIEVLSLNPLKNFEGNLQVSLETRLETAREWVMLAAAVGAELVQMPSQFLPESTGNIDAVLVPELRALADMAMQVGGISIAYEGVAFARHNPRWQDALSIVEAVNRPNFGLCLDSYHIHSLIWADPYVKSGRKGPKGDKELEESMSEFLVRCPKERVLYIQLSDASRFDPPLTDDSPLFDGLEVHDARLAWSRLARPFPLEVPGYFPVVDIARTWLIEYGWDGYVSLEGFLQETELEVNGPEVMAARAQTSIRNLYARLTQ
jgi:4-hydroxyphenylpyruvate dioxygenase